MKTKFEYKFTILYILLGGLWIIFSDKILVSFIKDPVLITEFQTYKGWFYVLMTSILFYVILKQHLTKLRNAERRAKESDALKTAFLRNISHEIRTPMNSIMGFTALLNENGTSDKEKAEYLRIISGSSNQLLSILTDIIDISLIESGSLKVIEKKVDLNMIIDELYDYFRPLIKKDIGLVTKKGLNDDECIVFTDDSKIMKVLSNMLNNSLKFTEKGHISFGYTVEVNKLKFSVEDTGIGIPEKFRTALFQRFQKAEINPGRFYEGLGLGLSICKGNVELLNGSIWFDSEPGRGSAFYFTVPYKPVS